MKYIVDNDISGNVMKVGPYLMGGLRGLKKKYPFVTDVRGRGLLAAIEFDSDIGQDILMACLEKGLLVNKVKPNAIRLMPPLIIGNNEVDRAIGILDQVISGFVK
jgi:4-aminobutyrate aminotransferase-like enzyme